MLDTAARRASASQLKRGLTSPPRAPQAWQVKRDSISDSRTSSGQSSPLIAVQWLAMVVGAVDQQAANPHFAHFAKRDFLRARHHWKSSPRVIAG
jgi:hypothetical protein